MFFSYTDYGETLQMFSLQHLLSVLIYAVLPCALLFVFARRLREWKGEPYLRVGIGVFGLLLEFGLYAWHIFSGGQRDWRNIVPTTLCGLSIYLGSYAMITLGKRVKPLVFFYSFGAYFSFLITDTPFGYDRFRYYTYFVIHGLIIFEAFYLLLVNRVQVDKKSFQKACIVLLPILAASFVLNQIFDMNFFYIHYPPFEDFPVYQQLFDWNRYAYTVTASLTYYILMSVVYGLGRIGMRKHSLPAQTQKDGAP
ncbi:MAG: TIGR02206 family membrane protein [Kiritimatiellae bacterium]|nr:TIGR02206 family membrane protein [Kiritimatiellia bacterium]